MRGSKIYYDYHLALFIPSHSDPPLILMNILFNDIIKVNTMFQPNYYTYLFTAI